MLPNNGYHIREEQISLAKQMYIGFTEKQIALCEAEVGTGKTLSYLVAAIVAKHHNSRIYAQKLPVTITTSSIELQKALVEREIPNLSRMLLDYSVKGAGQPHCYVRLCQSFQERSVPILADDGAAAALAR